MTLFYCQHCWIGTEEPEKTYTFTESQLRKIIDMVIVETANKLGFKLVEQ